MEIKECVDQLVEVIRNCPQLKSYHEALAELNAYPEKKKRVQEFRRKNFQLQNTDADIDLFTEVDRLADSFRDVYQDQVMQNYLKAEAALCKIVQTINASVVDSLDFEGLYDEEA